MRLKNVVFALVAMSLPLVGIVVLEGLLRVAGVAEQQRVAFLPVPGHEEYLAFNPNYLQRYFSNFDPLVAFDPFQKEKVDGTFRVFALGGSSTAGYPYHWSYSFPSRLQARLEAAAVGQTIEVINLGINAASSYVLWDLTDQLIAQDPDAIIIYAGHNEFYGAFGVGSTLHGFGNRHGLKRWTLRLKRSALFTFLVSLRPRAELTDDRSFFARAIDDAKIEFEGEAFVAGLAQYEANMRDLLVAFRRAGISVYAGTLAANLKDRVPLSDYAEAQRAYERGQTFFARGDTAAAREAFLEAKEKDTIRFRAPEALNTFLRAFETEELLTLVDVQDLARVQSESRIEDGSFFTDHIHPAFKGYDAIGGAFFDVVRDHDALDLTSLHLPDYASPVIDPIEGGYAHLQTLSVLSTFPFDRSATREQEMQFARFMLGQYRNSASDWDRMVHRLYTTGLSVPQALYDGIQLAKTKQDTLTTLLFYRAALDWNAFDDGLLGEAVAFGTQTLSYAALTEEILFHAINQTGQPRFFDQLADYRLRQGMEEDAVTLSALAGHH